MNYLLDTHALIWALQEPKKLGKGARGALESGQNVVWVSAASAWEIAIKAGYGKIRFPLAALPEALGDAGFVELAVNLRHTIVVKDLPPIHRDPFDRLLVAQALEEGLVLITHDEALSAYQVRTLWD
ncbi:MAG: type II toxin-antitoxin system VapC family toxin [Deltaproteobacteria bacterium]|nr:type II toxin-antitoxin system VapC family toxin [Deltaproteobacteria bacterium]